MPALGNAVVHSDQDLANRIRRGEQQAIGELYDCYGRIIYSAIYWIVRDKMTAEDLLQDTFVRIWQNAPTLEFREGALLRWMLTIARNRAIDYLRSARIRHETASATPLENTVLASGYDAESGFIGREHADLLRKALTTLGASQREVIRLAYYEGLSQTEIAELLGQPLGTIKSWARMALQHLREHLPG